MSDQKKFVRVKDDSVRHAGEVVELVNPDEIPGKFVTVRLQDGSHLEMRVQSIDWASYWRLN